MPYATRQDYIRRFGIAELVQLVDRDQDDVEDPGVLDGAFADADAEIDSYLSARYALPLASVPPALARIACDIARYRLHDNRATEEVRVRYTDAVRFLNSLASGAVQLGLAAPVASSADDAVPIFTASDRVFSAARLSDY